MIQLTFPDGSSREFDPGISGRDIAEGISKSLAKKALAVALDGAVTDLSAPIDDSAAIEIITKDDPRGLEILRHDCAHVMAEAVQALYPGTQVTIGPVIENGFYYDFARDEPFTTDDLPKIEAKMREIIGRDAPFTREVWDREQAKTYFAEQGEHYKVELIDAIPDGEEIGIYRQGDWLDLCRGPHMPSTGKIGNAFKLMKVAGAYWRGDANNPMLSRIYGTAWANDKELEGLSPHAGGGRTARPSAARPRNESIPFPGGRPRRRLLASQGLDHVPEPGELHAPAGRGRRL